MKTYTYSGPLSGVTMNGREVLLHPGRTVELDPDHPYTRTLIARRHLAFLDQLEAPPAPASTPTSAPAPALAPVRKAAGKPDTDKAADKAAGETI